MNTMSAENTEKRHKKKYRWEPVPGQLNKFYQIFAKYFFVVFIDGIKFFKNFIGSVGFVAYPPVR